MKTKESDFKGTSYRSGVSPRCKARGRCGRFPAKGLVTDFPLGCQSELRARGSVLTSFKQQNKMRTDPIAGTDTVARGQTVEG